MKRYQTSGDELHLESSVNVIAYKTGSRSVQTNQLFLTNNKNKLKNKWSMQACGKDKEHY